MSWTDERVELLKKLWADGLSAAKIAERLGSVTRNAVIGKVHRLGLSGRASTMPPRVRRPKVRPLAQKRQLRPALFPRGNPALQALYQGHPDPIPEVAELEIPLAERRSIASLTESSCRWPIGNPQTPEFHFCNGTKASGLPYCEFHARRAFQIPQTRGGARRDQVGAPRPAVAAPAAEPALAAVPAAAPAPKT